MTNANKINEGMLHLHTTLEDLHRSAAALAAQEHTAKRPRLEETANTEVEMIDPPEAPAASQAAGNRPGGRALEPFGRRIRNAKRFAEDHDVIARSFQAEVQNERLLSRHAAISNKITDHHFSNPINSPDDTHLPLPGQQPAARAAPHPLPDFARDVLAMTDEERIPLEDDWDLGVTTRTWYLHHVLSTRCDAPRPLQLVGEATTWNAQVLALWNDRILPGVQYEVHVVFPSPTRNAFDQHIAVDLIVSQGVDSELKSGLGTVRFNDDDTGTRSFAVAMSLPPRVSGRELARRIDVSALCDEWDCHLFHGWDVIPYTEDAVHDMQAGHSFMVFVNTFDPADISMTSHGPGEEEAEAEQDPGMQHAPDLAESPDYEPSIASDPMHDYDLPGHEQRNSFLIHRLFHESVHLFIRADTLEIATQEIARLIGISVHDIVALHFLRVTPVGDCPRTTSVILQSVGDIPPGSSDRLVLIDTEVHFDGHPLAVPPAPDSTRSVVRIVQHVIRPHLLMYADVDQYCFSQRDRCLVHVDHSLWSGFAPRELPPATYVRITVPPPDDPRISTLRAIELAQQGPLDADIDEMRMLSHGNSGSIPAADQTHSSGPTPFTPDTSHFPAASDDQWHDQLRELHASEGATENDDEGPVIYVQTWFVHHRTFRICDAPRTVRLDGFHTWWYHDICTAWQDRLQVDIPLRISRVQPPPPPSHFENFATHLVLEQESLPGLSAVLISALFVGEHGNRLMRRATSLSRWIDKVDVIDAVELGHVCDFRICRAWLGATQISLVPHIEAPSGAGLLLYIPPPDAVPVDTEPVDEVGLWQRYLSQICRPCLSDCDGKPDQLRLPDEPVDVSIVRPPVDEQIVHQHLPALQEQPSFIQDLHAWWEPVATLGPGRMERRAFVVVWFLDSTRMPECHLARAAALHEDYTRWMEEICQVWQDFLRLDLDLNAFLVSPDPPDREQGTVGHVILVQQPRPHACATLISVFDSAVAEGQVIRFAVFLPQPLTREDVLIAAHKDHLCGQWQLQNFCSVWHGRFQLLPAVPFPVRDGHGLTLVLHRTMRDDFWNEGPDALNLLQLSASQRLPPVSADLPKLVDLTSSTVPPEKIQQASTWLLHESQRPVCFKSRLLELSLDDDIESLFRGLWRDDLDGTLPLLFVHVRLTSRNETHVIGAQLAPFSDVSAILLSVTMFGAHDPMIAFRAALVPPAVSFADLCPIFGLDSGRIGPLRSACCQLHLNDQACSLDAIVCTEHGMFFNIQWSQDEIAAVPIQVDFSLVFRAHDFLDSHCLLPVFDLPAEFPWHPASQDWISADWWTPGVPCHELIIYYDGSSQKCEPTCKAGAAVAAFVRSHQQWLFAGAISTALDSGTSSYKAEMSAAILAHKFAHDVLKIAALFQAFVPDVELRFDSVTVGRQASGDWHAWSQPCMGALIRSLHRCIEFKLGVQLDHSHVKAHTGEPGNEVVDCLAFQAASGQALHDLQSWLHDVTRKEFVDAVEWVWYLFRTDVTWKDDCVLFPAGPTTCPNVSVFPASLERDEAAADTDAGSVTLCLATCNVLSLKPHAGVQVAIGDDGLATGPARQESLLVQFHAANVHIFAWQETRVRQISHAHDRRYWLFRSPANQKGHFGIMVGLHRILPIGQIVRQGRQVDVFFAEREISVIHATPRVLILKIANPLLRCVLVAGHAPHTGADAACIQSWWSDLASCIPAKYDQWPRLLLIDANVRIGDEPNDNVGGHQAEASDIKSEPFLDFLAQQGIWLPSTFAECHSGLGATWRHERGQWTRNDFVGLPMSWHLNSCTSWVATDIDVGLAKEDHRAAIVQFSRSCRPSSQLVPCPKLKLNLQSCDNSLFQGLTLPAWHVDVHSHAAELNATLTDAVWDHRVPRVKRPLKTSMTDLTWQLVCEKKECRNLLQERSSAQKATLLEAWFSAWKHAVHQCPATSLFQAFDALLHEQDRLIAVAYHQFRYLGIRVSKALKADDVAFYSALLAECSDFLQPAEVKNLWRVVRRSLHKYRQRRMMPAPFTLERLDDQWLPHYAELEAGRVTDPDALLSDCVLEQALRRLDAPLQLSLAELPSLTQLEVAFRSIAPDKSTGYDPFPSALFHEAASSLGPVFHDLFVKEFLWQCEPIQAKGGPVAILPKVQHPTVARQFRGILLLPSAGKRVHAILRSRIMATLSLHRPSGQLGGYPGQQVIYGSHAVRTFSVVCDSHGLSSAVLFLDLSSAFHHLIREAVVGSFDGSNLEPVLETLKAAGHPQETFHRFRSFAGCLSEMGLNEALVRLLRDIHLSTWCTLRDRWLLRTCRGTRPGSPLADIVFHALMVQVVYRLEEWMLQQDEFQTLLAQVNITAPAILWADDIAVPAVTKAASQLVPFLQSILVQVRHILQSYGFSLNFAKGKTSAVLALRGPQSAELRRQFLLHQNPGVLCEFPDGESTWLHFVAAYKHLGTVFASNHDLQCELRMRVGLAKQAFSQLSRPILTNRNMPLKLRLQMFNSLIATKLFFGLGAWTTPTPKQMQYLQGNLVTMLKKVLRTGQAALSAGQIFAKASTGDVRARLAIERLMYAQRLFRTGPDFLHHLLHIEFSRVDHSWLHGLKADLAWMHAVDPSCLPSGWDADMTELFDVWQRPGSHWKRAVTAVWKKHLLQERIIADAKMRDALPTSGPSVNPQTAVDVRRAAVLDELARCRAQLEISQPPDEPLVWGELIGERLTQVTLDWFHAHYPQGPDDSERALLADAWVATLCGSELPGDEQHDDWLEMIFLTWGEHWLPEVVATLEDGVAEADIDTLYADFAADLQRYQLLARVAHLELCLRECVPSVPTAHRVKPAHPALRHPKVSSQVRQAVPRAFALQAQWQRELRLTRFFDFPEDQVCPKLLLRDGTQAFLIIHLFSGRRRPFDVHHHLYSFAHERNLQVLVLSLDTAVSTEFGDLSLSAESWQMVEFLYSQGVVSATVVGSPCETFSEARFTPVEGLGENGGPRPLRSAAQLFGLEGLSLRELRQCLVGGNFFQQAVLALGHHLAHGGCFISEHPAKPLDATRPSVWTSAIVELLLTHPSATLSHVAQYRWGAKAIKPTGLLHYNLPYFLRDLYAQQDVHAQKPTTAAIGRDAEGRYRTSQHKEYPDRFCRGLAYTVIQALTAVQRQSRFRVVGPLTANVEAWIQGASTASSKIYRSSWLPDFQS
eukprot:s36_g10.t1